MNNVQTDKGPAISYKFPQVIDVNDEIAKAAPSFCFPEGQGNAVQSKKETFSFTLTTGTGEKRFGYCRRFVSGSSEPECYCIVSQKFVPWIRHEVVLLTQTQLFFQFIL